MGLVWTLSSLASASLSIALGINMTKTVRAGPAGNLRLNGARARRTCPRRALRASQHDRENRCKHPATAMPRTTLPAI